jgi:hypothetical protein
VAKWAWDVHFNTPIRPEAALVHGCKDGTLLDLLIEAPPPPPTQSDRDEKVSKVLAAHRKLISISAAARK